jgi:phosphatidylinositol alpha-mannosyltransferase
MKIALVSPYDWTLPGGVNRHVSNLAEQFIGDGHDVRIVAPSSRRQASDPEYLTVIGESMVGLPASGSVANVCLSFNLGPRVKALLSRESFDVVHIHEPFMPLLPFQFLRYSNATNIATFHAAREGGSRLYAYAKFILQPWWHRIDGRIAHSRSSLRLVGKHFADRYRIIPSGVDCSFFAGAEPLSEYMDGKRNILFLGRLEKRKGLPFLLEAYGRLKPDMPDTRLIVVGGDGGLRTACERYVEREGLADVVFTGYVPDELTPRYFKTGHIYCAPNTGGESLGIVLLEAMAAGAPIVASGIEGFADVVTGGRDGILFPPGDSEGLSQALKRLLSDQTMRERIGKQAAKSAQKYDWNLMSGQVLSYYEEAIAARERGQRRA